VAPPVVLFDGLCGLCDRLVDFALAADRAHRLRFAPLQGRTARALLGDAAGAVDSLAVAVDGVVLQRSAAVLAVLAHLGGPWRLLAAAARLLPGPLREAGYRFVAARRYRWFGRKDACRQPGPEERAYFLD